MTQEFDHNIVKFEKELSGSDFVKWLQEENIPFTVEKTCSIVEKYFYKVCVDDLPNYIPVSSSMIARGLSTYDDVEWAEDFRDHIMGKVYICFSIKDTKKIGLRED